MSRDIRWLQRFDNFSKACARLLVINLIPQKYYM